jgi:hypothetical protein
VLWTSFHRGIIKAVDLVAKHFDSWADTIQNKIVPILQIWVSKGCEESLGAYPLGSYVNIIDPATGAMIRAHRRVADKSYRSPGHPNKYVFELYNDKIRQDRTRLERSRDQSPGGTASAWDVHIHSNPTYYVTINGAGSSHEELRRFLVAQHSRHIEQLRRDLGEVE